MTKVKQCRKQTLMHYVMHCIFIVDSANEMYYNSINILLESQSSIVTLITSTQVGFL